MVHQPANGYSLAYDLGLLRLVAAYSSRECTTRMSGEFSNSSSMGIVLQTRDRAYASPPLPHNDTQQTRAQLR